MRDGELCAPLQYNPIKPLHCLASLDGPADPPRPASATPCPPRTGILGENLVIPPFLTDSVSRFYALNATALAMCFCFFYSIILYMKWRKLI